MFRKAKNEGSRPGPIERYPLVEHFIGAETADSLFDTNTRAFRVEEWGGVPSRTWDHARPQPQGHVYLLR